MLPPPMNSSLIASLKANPAVYDDASLPILHPESVASHIQCYCNNTNYVIHSYAGVLWISGSEYCARKACCMYGAARRQ